MSDFNSDQVLADIELADAAMRNLGRLLQEDRLEMVVVDGGLKFYGAEEDDEAHTLVTDLHDFSIRGVIEVKARDDGRLELGLVGGHA